MGEKKEMEQYLEEKYGGDYSVSNVEVQGGGVGFKGSLSGLASPSDDNELNFKVLARQNGTFSDNYPESVWSRQLQEEFEPIASKLLGKESKVNATISFAYMAGRPDITDNIGTYKDAVEMYGKKLYARIEITNPNVSNDKNDRIKLFDTIKRVKELGIRAMLSYKEKSQDGPRYYLEPNDIQSLKNTEELIKHYHRGGEK